jgi:hypothetical protein
MQVQVESNRMILHPREMTPALMRPIAVVLGGIVAP